MKLHVDRADIQRSGVDTETEFKIKTTAKAFDILSSGLYTDNILAIVRELSCNAYDAHVAAKKADVPFEIHLPNRLEPFFAVKDFGTGLSDEQIMTLYTTYFDSTKTESNDFIGALGLGSKSPFSYAKAFEVISRFNGVRRVYSIFINEDGVPTIARIGEPMATDEHNGLEVKMTVESNDFYRFSSKTSSALRWFPVKPKVVGEAHFEFNEPPQTDMQGDGWFIYKHGYNTGYMHAVQGNVEYRVDIDHIEEIPDSVKAFLKKVNVIGFFEIGELEVAASREEIRYDKRTKEALAKKVESIHKAALKSIEDKADSLTASEWEAIIELDQLSNSMFRDSSQLREFVAVSEHPVLKAYAESKGRVKLVDHPGHEVYTYKWGRYGRNLKRSQCGTVVNPHRSTAIFVNDLRTGGVGRMTEWLRNNSHYDNLVVIAEKKNPVRYEEKELADGTKDMVKHDMTEQEVAAEFTAIVNGLGKPKVHVVSQDTTTARRSGTKSRLKAIFKYRDFHNNAYRPDTVEWSRVEEIDMEEGGLYFLLERGRTMKWNDKTISWPAHQVFQRMEAAVDVINTHLGLTGDGEHVAGDVLGVGALDIKKFESHDKWVNMFDLLAEAIPSYQAAAEAKARWEHTPNVNGLKDVFREKRFMEYVEKLDADSTFRKVVETISKAHRELNDLHLVHTEMVRNFDRDYGKKEIHPVDVKGHIEEDALKEYPMLEFVETISVGGWRNTNLEVLFDYINTTDGSKK